MKKSHLLNYGAVMLSTLCLAVTQADAKPDKGNKGGKDKDKGAGQGHNKQDDNKGKGNGQAQNKQDDNNGKKDNNRKFVPFKDDQRNEIVRYFDDYQQKNKGLPPGLAMNQRRGKPLPPGWEKKLTPGYRIDDDSWSSFEPVPNDWFPNLRMEPETRLYHYGDRIVRVHEPRREVLDVVLLNLLK